MDKPIFKVDKVALRNFVEGYRKANEMIWAEKKKWLSQLKAEDSLLQYDDLCRMWEMGDQKQGLGRLEKQRVSFLVEMRKRFAKAANLGKPK